MPFSFEDDIGSRRLAQISIEHSQPGLGSSLTLECDCPSDEDRR